jgi:SWIM zinc finger
MVAVREITWEEASAPGFETTTRQAWRQAVAEIAEKAKAKLPECSGRVESAVKIVLAGDVDLQADGTAKVASQSNGTTAYHVVNGQCDCKDFAKAPHGFCKHRLAAAIARRAQELVKATVAAPEGQTAAPGQSAQPEALGTPLPEAPASVNCHITIEGRQVQVTLRDTDETRLLRRLAALLRHYPQTPTQPAYPDPQRRSAGLVCQARRTDAAQPQRRPLLVVPLDTRGLVQRQVDGDGDGERWYCRCSPPFTT